jgi:hypothetical protein
MSLSQYENAARNQSAARFKRADYNTENRHPNLTAKTELEVTDHVSTKEVKLIEANKGQNRITSNAKNMISYLRDPDITNQMLIRDAPKTVTTVELNQKLTARRERLRSANAKYTSNRSPDRNTKFTNSTERVVGYGRTSSQLDMTTSSMNDLLNRKVKELGADNPGIKSELPRILGYSRTSQNF